MRRSAASSKKIQIKKDKGIRMVSIPLKMVEAVLRTGLGAFYYRCQMDRRGETPFTLTVWKIWGKCCLNTDFRAMKNQVFISIFERLS